MATATNPRERYMRTLSNNANSSQNNLSNSARSYAGAMQGMSNRPVQPTQTQASPRPAVQSAAQSSIQPSRTSQTLNTINDLTNQGYTFTGPKEFTYDQNTDPAYQAALASARQNITQQQADTNAALRAGGQGKSSYSESVANQIGAKEMGRVSTDVLPQLISQAYQRYADQANRDLALQQANYGVTQDRIGNLSNLYGLQYQEDYTRPMAEAQLTGQYLSGEARQYINAINDLKAQAETPGITAAERSQLSAQADQYRRALQGLGIDSSLFGADVNRTNSLANTNRAGILTLDAQQQQYAQQADQRNFDYQQQRDSVADQQWQQQFGVTLAQVTGYLPDGTPTSAEQQRQLENLWLFADQMGTVPNQLADMYGIPRGTQTRAAKEFAAQLAISQQNANASSLSAQASYMNALTNRQQENRIASTPRSSGSSSSSSGSSSSNKLSAKESYDNYSLLLDDMARAGTKDRARQLLQANTDYLTDSDYKKLADYINKTFQ